MFLTFDMDGDGPEPTDVVYTGTADPHADPGRRVRRRHRPRWRAPRRRRSRVPRRRRHRWPAATTTRSRAVPRPTGRHRHNPDCASRPTAEVATAGRPFAVWATIDVTQASDGEVRYGLACTGVTNTTGYGLAVTINAPPTTTIGWQAVSGASQAGTPVTVYGNAMRQVGPTWLPGGSRCSLSAVGRAPRRGPPGCSSPSTWTATAPSPATSCTPGPELEKRRVMARGQQPARLTEQTRNRGMDLG